MKLKHFTASVLAMFASAFAVCSLLFVIMDAVLGRAVQLPCLWAALVCALYSNLYICLIVPNRE